MRISFSIFNFCVGGYLVVSKKMKKGEGKKSKPPPETKRRCQNTGPYPRCSSSVSFAHAILYAGRQCRLTFDANAIQSK